MIKCQAQVWVPAALKRSVPQRKDMRRTALAFFALMVGMMVTCFAEMDIDRGCDEILLSIGRDIEQLKTDYPQLEAFSVSNNVNVSSLSITYDFKTHSPERRGGWRSGVPSPDADGIWFYIDFHDPDSTAQIHTQPVAAEVFLGDKKVSFLILEGAETKHVAGAIWRILESHGAKERS
jgi:hypothetical protein